jgi:hypothetical protein
MILQTQYRAEDEASKKGKGSYPVAMLTHQYITWILWNCNQLATEKRIQQKREGTTIGTVGNQKTKSLIVWHKEPVNLTKQQRQVGTMKKKE